MQIIPTSNPKIMQNFSIIGKICKPMYNLSADIGFNLGTVCGKSDRDRKLIKN